MAFAASIATTAEKLQDYEHSRRPGDGQCAAKGHRGGCERAAVCCRTAASGAGSLDDDPFGEDAAGGEADDGGMGQEATDGAAADLAALSLGVVLPKPEEQLQHWIRALGSEAHAALQRVTDHHRSAADVAPLPGVVV